MRRLPAERDRLTTQLVDAGSFVLLDDERKPSSFWCASDPADEARVEDRTFTFTCSGLEADAGPTNHWMDPVEMTAFLGELYRRCTTGRTLYVVPFCTCPLGAADPELGVQLTDSAYVVVSMQVMTRMGPAVLDALGTDAPFVKALPSVGAPLAPARPTWRDRAAGPSTSATSRRPGRSAASAPATGATPCSARCAARCASRR